MNNTPFLQGLRMITGILLLILGIFSLMLPILPAWLLIFAAILMIFPESGKTIVAKLKEWRKKWENRRK